LDTTFEILQLVNNIEDYSYLELGVGDNINFSKMPCKDKTSVDVIPGLGNFTGTTDYFFEELDKDKIYDFIFIDANHCYDNVLRDFNNSIKHCKRFLFLHDLVPLNESYTNYKYCWDGYKILYYILKETQIKPLIWNEPLNMGLTTIQMPCKPINPPHIYRDITYKEFKDYIKTLKMFTKEEISYHINEILKIG
jgi:hypothetical protein